MVSVQFTLNLFNKISSCKKFGLRSKMGGSQTHPNLTEDILEDYKNLTYLSQGEILYLMKKFKSIDPEKVLANYHHRVSKQDIIDKFDVLQNNPFKDRIFQVFSSQKDDCFSFEDLLDLCSVMSAECPPEVKAVWAFRIYDLDDDKQISARDISEIIDRLTADSAKGPNCIDDEAKTKIAQIILKEIKLDNSGTIELNEFTFIMSRIPEFKSSFYFRL